MANEIANGVEQLASGERNLAQSEHQRKVQLMFDQWQDLRGKIDSLLLSTNVMKSNEIRGLCQQLDGMSHDQRMAHISQHWGAMYLQRVEPLLFQLQTLEGNIAKAEEEQNKQSVP